MKKSEERNGTERRTFTILNANPPFLTRRGVVLYDRRTGRDRRDTEPKDIAKEPSVSLVEI